MKPTAKQKIEALAKTLPSKAINTSFAESLSSEFANTIIKMAEQLAQVQINKATTGISVNPSINIPDIKVPAIKMPPIKIPQAHNVVNVPEIKVPPANITVEQPSQESANKWEFTIHRENNGLMHSVTAERIS